MLIAIFADIHSNRQAFSACLAQAKSFGAQQFVLLGDLVGYGADPEWAVQTAIELIEKGALAVLGNHDSAVSNSRERMNVEAQIAIEWTRGALALTEQKFLEQLPLTREHHGHLYVHADASSPRSWRYVLDADDAARSMRATSSSITFCGHVHRPALYTRSATGTVSSFTPTAGVAIRLLPHRQWLAVLGSVGQPRDGNPAASYAIFDTDRRELTYCRAPYDVEEAGARIRQAGLPAWLADRLLLGR